MVCSEARSGGGGSSRPSPYITMLSASNRHSTDLVMTCPAPEQRVI